MHRSLCPYDLAAESLAYGLMTQADAENGELACKILYSLNGDPCVLGIGGTRGDDQCFGLHFLDLFNGYLVISENPDVAVKACHCLIYVIGEAVVVIYHYDHFYQILSKITSVPLPLLRLLPPQPCAWSLRTHFRERCHKLFLRLPEHMPCRF